MKIKESQIKEQSQTKYTVTIEGKEWQDCLRKGLEKITKNIQVPGFRKGKVPMDVVKGKVSDEDIIQESASFASDMAFKYVIKEKSPELIMQPVLLIDEVDQKKAVLSFLVQNLPEIKLDKYTKLGIKKESAKFTKAEVKKDMESLLSRYAKLKDKTGVATKGDVVVIDFEGFVGGKSFEGGKAEGYSLEIGSGQFIPGFEDQLIGSKSGEKKDVEVTFPKEYHSKNLANKKAIFKCKVHKVLKKTTPKLTDDFVKENKFPGVKTAAEFEEKLKEAMKKQKEMQASRVYEDAIIEKLIQNAKFDVPVRFIELETNTLIKEFEDKLAQQGLDIPKFKEMTGKDDQTIAADFATQAEKRCRVSLIFEHIAKKENIDIKKEDVDAEYKKIAEDRKVKVAEVEKQIPAGRLAYKLRMKKIFEVITK